MENNSALLQKIVAKALSGEGAHAATKNIFDGVDWKIARIRPPNASHSIYEIMLHIFFWQEWGINWFAGRKPAVPRHAAGSWPKSKGPRNAEEWKRALRKFRAGLEALEQRARKTDLTAKIGATTRLEMLHALASHASYHAGEVVIVRQILGAWPPPSGGLTW